MDQTPPTRDLAVATRDLALLLVSQAMEAQGSLVVPRVCVVEGPDVGADLPLHDEGRAYVLGRGEECELPLADADASRTHVRLVRRGQTILVRDLGSKNGAFLGESRLLRERDVAWKHTLFLRLGQTVLALEEPAAVALGELENAEDEPMAAGDTPPQPEPLVGPPTPTATQPEPSPAEPALPASDATAAPIAEEGGASKSTDSAPAAMRRGAWSATDIAVVIAALAVIGLSIAGLVWLLRS
jgi:pSer/pThr/pTyr-binding forkhead associated (FHA) protein